MRRAVARRYAQALLDVLTGGEQSGDVRSAKQQLAAFLDVWERCRELRLVLDSPSVAGSAKVRVITGIAESLGLPRIIRNFLCVLQRHRRLPELRNIIAEFELLWYERCGIVNAIVTAAMPLNADQQAAIERALSAKYSKPVKLDVRIDPALIGGVQVQVGSTVYDGSVRGYLAALHKRLLSARPGGPRWLSGV